MPKRAVAFVETEKSTDWAVCEAIKAGVDHLITISEDELSITNEVRNLHVEKKRITSFRSFDLDRMVLKEIEQCYSDWLQKNPGLASILKEVDIEYALSASYSAIIFQLFRRIVLFKCVLEDLKPDIIITDKHWRKFCPPDVLDMQNTILIEESNNYARATRGRGLRIIIMAAIAGVGGIIAPIFLGKFVNWFAKTKIKLCSCLLIGDYFPNKSFAPVWKSIHEDDDEKGELLLGSISISEVRRSIKDGNRWVEGYCCCLTGVSLLLKYFKIIWHYWIGRYSSYPLPNKDFYYRLNVPLSTDIAIDLDWFFMRSFARATCFVGQGKNFKKKFGMNSVVFSRLSPATRSLSHQLRRLGVKTISTTHGMVLEPIAYKTHDSVKLTWGGFDANVLKAFSDDDTYIGLSVNPEGYRNIPTTPKEGYINSQNLIKKIFPLSLGNTFIYSELKGKCAAVFPSTNQHGACLRRFLSLSIVHLFDKRERYGIDYIVVKPKKHPRTNYDEFYSILSDIVGKDSPIPVVFSDRVDISSLLNFCTFCLCAHSSIMLDCIRMNVPFSVYLNDSLSDRNFVSRMPAWMIYRSEKDLNAIERSYLDQFNQTAARLRRVYWGEDESKSQLLMLKKVLGFNLL